MDPLPENLRCVALQQALAAWARIPYRAGRDRGHVLREYDRDKYGSLLASAPATWEQLLALEAGRPPDAMLTVSVGDRLVGMTAAEADSHAAGLVGDALARYVAPGYCELGCGFGRNLRRLGACGYGGELTSNGVALARRMGLDVARFDFNDPNDYALVRPDTTVFTVHALEQLTSALPFLENLRRCRANVRWVVHLEPGICPGRSNLLGDLRNGYTRWNAYNQDLDLLLRAAPDVEIVEASYDLFGVNPLNPTHLLAWRFR